MSLPAAIQESFDGDSTGGLLLYVSRLNTHGRGSSASVHVLPVQRTILLALIAVPKDLRPDADWLA